MARNSKSSKSRGRSWKNERASVDDRNKSRPRSNKYRTSDQSRRKENAEQFWRAGYTRKDGTKVKGHYVKRNASLIDKIRDAIT